MVAKIGRSSQGHCMPLVTRRLLNLSSPAGLRINSSRKRVFRQRSSENPRIMTDFRCKCIRPFTSIGQSDENEDPSVAQKFEFSQRGIGSYLLTLSSRCTHRRVIRYHSLESSIYGAEGLNGPKWKKLRSVQRFDSRLIDISVISGKIPVWVDTSHVEIF